LPDDCARPTSIGKAEDLAGGLPNRFGLRR